MFPPQTAWWSDWIRGLGIQPDWFFFIWELWWDRLGALWPAQALYNDTRHVHASVHALVKRRDCTVTVFNIGFSDISNIVLYIIPSVWTLWGLFTVLTVAVTAGWSILEWCTTMTSSLHGRNNKPCSDCLPSAATYRHTGRCSENTQDKKKKKKSVCSLSVLKIQMKLELYLVVHIPPLRPNVHLLYSDTRHMVFVIRIYALSPEKIR